MKTTLSSIHHQAADWLRELDFYTDEISLVQHRLEEALAKNKSPKLVSQFEDFRAQFKSLLKQIDVMKHDVSVRDTVAENMLEEALGEDEEISLPEDVILKQMKDLVRDIADTRFLFNFFLSKQG